MSPDVTVHLAPTSAAKVTPLELLEDFADAQPNWLFLEHETRHYAVEKGVAACVVRYASANGLRDADLVFAAEHLQEHTTTRLTLVAAAADHEELDPVEQQRIVDRFLDAFHGYLQRREGHVQLRVVRQGDVVTALS